ncbi:MAG: hypothetical protein HC906_09505 [Bacteroidales bacterium]|nr:hypothetical protein [Bacteroidales bacterium]
MKFKFLLLTLLNGFYLISFSQADTSVNNNSNNENLKTFASWDINNDNRLTLDEFLSSFYSMYDKNNDNEIMNDEWNDQANILAESDTLNSLTSDEGYRYGAGQGMSNSLWNLMDKNFSESIGKEEFYNSVRMVFEEWDNNNDNF